MAFGQGVVESRIGWGIGPPGAGDDGIHRGLLPIHWAKAFLGGPVAGRSWRQGRAITVPTKTWLSRELIEA
jgi:hypothetical protein